MKNQMNTGSRQKPNEHTFQKTNDQYWSLLGHIVKITELRFDMIHK